MEALAGGWSHPWGSALVLAAEVLTRVPEVNFGDFRLQIKQPRKTASFLHPRDRHDLDDLDPRARHHLQVRMVLAEHLRGRVMGLCLHDRIAADAVLCVRGSFRVDALGLT